MIGERGGQSGLLRGDTDFTLEVNLLLEVKIKVFFSFVVCTGNFASRIAVNFLFLDFISMEKLIWELLSVLRLFLSFRI